MTTSPVQRSGPTDGKVLWHFTMSLDGFIADANHTMDRRRDGAVRSLQHTNKLTHVRGPSGIIVMLAEELQKS